MAPPNPPPPLHPPLNPSSIVPVVYTSEIRYLNCINFNNNLTFSALLFTTDIYYSGPTNVQEVIGKFTPCIVSRARVMLRAFWHTHSFSKLTSIHTFTLTVTVMLNNIIIIMLLILQCHGIFLDPYFSFVYVCLQVSHIKRILNFSTTTSEQTDI